MAVIDFGGVKEKVVMRKEFSMAKARSVLKNETIAVIGYGVQGPAQSLNMRDNGFNVIVGQSKAFKKDWNRAVPTDGCRDTPCLISRRRRSAEPLSKCWYLTLPRRQSGRLSKSNLNPGEALYFSHGFSIVYKKQTNVIPPKHVDVIMVAPKGSGTSLRRNFLSGAGINASFAVEQDATGRAWERCIALGIAIGSGYLFPTTFRT